jgi:peptidylprolyl isomerase
MRTLLAACAVLALAACGEKKVDTAATTEPAAPAASTPAAAEPAAPAAPEAYGKPIDTAAWTKYVPWNHAWPEVKKTGTGLEYVVLGSGKGKSPTRQQQAEVFYEGRLNAGGGPFDSAYQRGGTETFPVGSVVPGFSEALTLMKPGDHWLIFLPSALGYGERAQGDKIPANSDLVFELELVSVK